jgi:hypothetical protein
VGLPVLGEPVALLKSLKYPYSIQKSAKSEIKDYSFQFGRADSGLGNLINKTFY